MLSKKKWSRKKKEKNNLNHLIHMIKEDLEYIGMSIESEHQITEMYVKVCVCESVCENAFNNLQDIKQGHKKVKDLVHTNISQPQDYITSSILDNQEKALLFNLRTQSVDKFKANFSHKYSNLSCPMCILCENSQEHSTSCAEVTQHIGSEHKDILQSI